MADLIHVDEGMAPWEPSHKATMLEALHVHDIPLVGILKQDGVHYVFQCLLGELEPVNFWGYTLVEVDEIERLREASGPDEFDAVLADMTQGRSSVVALAIEGVGIVGMETVDDIVSELPSLVESLVAHVEERAQRVTEAVPEARSLAASGSG